VIWCVCVCVCGCVCARARVHPCVCAPQPKAHPPTHPHTYLRVAPVVITTTLHRVAARHFVDRATAARTPLAVGHLPLLVLLQGFATLHRLLQLFVELFTLAIKVDQSFGKRCVRLRLGMPCISYNRTKRTGVRWYRYQRVLHRFPHEQKWM
jgi:hypothetical protein